MKTRITDLLGCQYPVIQGGMAWVAEYHLAAAVSEAGGIGLIGAASAPPEVVREQIRKTKELTDKPFGVNVMLLNPNAPEVAKVVVEEGVKIVTTGAGNPGKFMEMWKQAGLLKNKGNIAPMHRDIHALLTIQKHVLIELDFTLLWLQQACKAFKKTGFSCT